MHIHRYITIDVNTRSSIVQLHVINKIYVSFAERWALLQRDGSLLRKGSALVLKNKVSDASYGTRFIHV